MRTLAFMNILDIRTGDGTYVSDLKPETLVEHLEFVLTIDDSTIQQLLQARQLVEPELAALAAANITETELAKLNQQLAIMHEAGDSWERISELDVTLHMLIAEASHNPFLIRFMSSLRHLGKQSRERTSQIESIRNQAKLDHNAIVAAINNHNPDTARQAMQSHLQHIEDGLKNP
jgi:GntR family transcriptional repressor for pyruvate dehydrogenase complex